MDRRSEEDLLTRYYIEQTGHGSEVYRGALYQKGEMMMMVKRQFPVDSNMILFSGYGFGSFLGGLFRTVIPLIKKGLPFIGKELLKSSATMLDDVVDRDMPFRDSFRMRGRESLQNLKKQALQGMTGSGLSRKRKRSQSKSTSGRVKKRKTTPRKKSKKLVTKKKKTTKKSKVPSNSSFAYL